MLYVCVGMAETEAKTQKAPKRLPSPLWPGIAADVKLLINLVKKDVPITKKTRLLEVGCGWGIYTFHLDRVCNVHGIDTSLELLDRNPIDNTQVMDVRELRFDDNTFDVVFAHDMLHRVPELDTAIQEMRRVSKRYVVVAEPNILNLVNLIISVATPEERSAHRFTLWGLENIVARNDLRVLRTRTYGMAIPFLTPRMMVPLASKLSFNQPLGLEHLIVAEKV